MGTIHEHLHPRTPANVKRGQILVRRGFLDQQIDLLIDGQQFFRIEIAAGQLIVYSVHDLHRSSVQQFVARLELAGLAVGLCGRNRIAELIRLQVESAVPIAQIVVFTQGRRSIQAPVQQRIVDERL